MKRHALVILAIISLGIVARADDRRTKTAIDSGLAWLADQQNLDGSIGTNAKDASTADALLAFLSAGNTSDGGNYATTVRRATEYLLRQAPTNRDFGRADGSGDDGQAIVVLALCQEYGVEPDDALRDRTIAILKDAVAVLGRQKVTDSRELAMAAARRIGVAVPESPAARPATAPTPATDAALLDAQRPDGSWTRADLSDSDVRATARAIRLLSRGRRFVPGSDEP